MVAAGAAAGTTAGRVGGRTDSAVGGGVAGGSGGAPAPGSATSVNGKGTAADHTGTPDASGQAPGAAAPSTAPTPSGSDAGRGSAGSANGSTSTPALSAAGTGSSSRLATAHTVDTKASNNLTTPPSKSYNARASLTASLPQRPPPRIKQKQTVTQMLHLHELSSSLGASPDLLLSQDGFPHLQQGDLVQIFIPSIPTRRLTLEVNYQEKKGDRGTTNLQVSVLKSLAEMFDLKAFTDVVVYGPIEPEDAAVTFVELHFKDQFISRGDMWRFTEAMMNLPVHRKKTFDLLGMRVWCGCCLTCLGAVASLRHAMTSRTHHSCSLALARLASRISSVPRSLLTRAC